VTDRQKERKKERQIDRKEKHVSENCSTRQNIFMVIILRSSMEDGVKQENTNFKKKKERKREGERERERGGVKEANTNFKIYFLFRLRRHLSLHFLHFLFLFWRKQLQKMLNKNVLEYFHA
jgi:hypothetical protein